VAVRNGRIAALGRIEGDAKLEVDAKGLVVAPGFIDVHTHAEDIEDQPLAENFLRMGVTTLVLGNCGGSELNLGAFFRRLAARAGKAKAVTATARKLAVLFYNALRFGTKYVDPGENHYEQNYQERVVHQLHRRAKKMGFTLVKENATVGVS